MHVSRRLGKYEVDFTGDLILTKNNYTGIEGRDVRDFLMMNLTRVPIETFKHRFTSTFKVLWFIWTK